MGSHADDAILMEDEVTGAIRGLSFAVLFFLEAVASSWIVDCGVY